LHYLQTRFAPVQTEIISFKFVQKTINMRKTILTVGMFVMSLSFMNSQTVLFTENFTNPSIDWEVIDSDADGNSWGLYDFTVNPSATAIPALNDELNAQGKVAISSSWSGGVALTPDNYFITPLIDLTNIPNQANAITFTFKVGSTQSSPNFISENVSVYIVSDLNNLASATAIHTGVLAQIGMTEFTYDISTYAGSSVLIAFRHHNCTDEGDLLLDDILVTKAQGLGIEEKEIKMEVFPNPVSEKLNIKAEAVISNAKIYALDGKLVLDKKVNEKNFNLDVNSLPNGVYSVELESNSGNKLFAKFVKN
jgi:hypothetical protein